MISLHIWKDASMLVCSMLAVALLAWHGRKPRAWMLLAASALLFYAMAVRHNAVFGVLPLIYALTSRAGAQAGSRSLAKNVAVFALVAGMMIAGASFVNTHGARKVSMSGLLMAWDLSAVSVYTDQLLVPRYLFLDPSAPDETLLAGLKQRFTTDFCHPVFKVLNAYPPRHVTRRLAQDWMTTVVQRWRAYLRHRRIVAQRLLGLGMPLCQPYHQFGIDGNAYGFHFVNQDSLAFKGVWSLMSRLRNTLVYRPWVYLSLAILASVALLSRGTAVFHDSGLALALPLSLSRIALSSVDPDRSGTEYRYVIWTVAASLWSLVLAKHYWLREQSRPSEDKEPMPSPRTETSTTERALLQTDVISHRLRSIRPDAAVAHL
jgi:hypothetical protein